MIATTNLQQPLSDLLMRNTRVAHSVLPLNERLRDTLVKMRERMNNLEVALGQSADENFNLAHQQAQYQAQLQLLNNALHLAGVREQNLQTKVDDLEAQLAAYRRQALADRKEIEALKDQLFA